MRLSEKDLGSVNRSLQFHSERNELSGDGKSFLNGF